MKYRFLFYSVLSFLFVTCQNNGSNYTYRSPEAINDGLQVGSLAGAGLAAKIIEKGVSKIGNGSFGEVHAILIYKQDSLVLEEYFQGHQYKWDAKNYHGELVNWNRSMTHDMMSCTKSITSACIDIAIEKGFIKDIHQSIFDYLPDYQHLKVNNREYITIEHLVTMTSGLAWDEWSALHGSSANDIDALWFDCKETIPCVLDRQWWKEPGELFTYNGGGTIVLGEIIKNASGMNLYEFAKKHLFEPLGITNTQWHHFPSGVWDGSGSLHMTPRDMIKFGATYLNKGLWKGNKIVSSNWVEKSSVPFRNNIDINIPGEDSGKNGYGYTWWTSEFSHAGEKIKMYRAGGWGGQEIMVFPELDMVVVFTGGNYAKKTQLYKIIKRYVLPAIN